MAAYSALDFVTRALRLLGVCDPTETPEPEDAETGFTVLNDMVDAWGTQRQTIYKITRNVFSLTSGTSTYLLGPSGTWALTLRPVWIDRVSVIPVNSGTGNTGPLEIPLGNVLDIAQYQAISIKTATSAYPTKVYWDRSFVGSGLSNIVVYPVPTSTTAAIVLYIPSALTQFADQSTQYQFPPGYAKALRYNLAVELAPEYGIEVPKVVARQAGSSLADIKRANFAPLEAQFDNALVGRRRYNIYTDS